MVFGAATIVVPDTVSPAGESLAHVAPPSLDLCRPFVRLAYTIDGAAESIASSTALVALSTNNVCAQVLPPSVVRYTPRAALGLLL